MPVTQIPPRGPTPPPPTEHRDLFEAQHWETAYRGFNPDDVPHLLIQLQDDLSRARKREAIWLSVILHLFVVILLWNSEKLVALLPHHTVPLELQANLDRDKDATFLELPPDQQHATRKPDAKVLSDKDRIATSKTPQLNRDELKKLLAATPHPGAPGNMGPQVPPQPQAAQTQAPPQQQPQQSNPQPGNGFAQPQTSDQTAQLRTPPQGNRPVPNFNNSTYAGDLTAQAAQAAANNRGHYGGMGNAGDYGLTRGRGGMSAVVPGPQIISDTRGVDFGAYLTQVYIRVRGNWYNLLPPSVYPPILKQGKLSLQFAILKDGTVAGLAIHTDSGDIALDRAALGSITVSNPFPPLPREYLSRCPTPIRDDQCNLGLRFGYYYNLPLPSGDDSDLR